MIVFIVIVVGHVNLLVNSMQSDKNSKIQDHGQKIKPIQASTATQKKMTRA